MPRKPKRVKENSNGSPSGTSVALLAGSSSEVTSKVPPPQERLCHRHQRPICPSRWRCGCRTVGCSVCTHHRLDGTKGRAQVRHSIKGRQAWKYRGILKNRRAFIGKTHGVKLWERSTGMSALFPIG